MFKSHGTSPTAIGKARLLNRCKGASGRLGFELLELKDPRWSLGMKVRAASLGFKA